MTTLDEFRLPALGADMDQGTIVEWRIEPGSTVKRGDVVAVVETDKGAIDVEIFLDGLVREIVVPVGAKVPVGTPLALIETATGAAHAPQAAPAPPEAAAAGPKVSPAARRRARELGVDIAVAHGTGPGGAITLEDVERAQAPAVASAPRPQAAAAPPSPQASATAPSPPAPDSRAAMRDAIASAMARSKREIPHYYLTATVDVTAAVDWLATHNAAVPVTERLLFPALMLKAVALACTELSGFSGFHVDGRYERGPVVHVGMAVALRGGGLVAPAILDTAKKPLDTVMREFRDLVTRARAGRLRASELSAPTIVLTSLGEDAPIDTVLPIIQPPQVAIVGAGSISDRPWVVGGVVVPCKTLTLSLAADHRVTDGRLGAQFLARVAARLGDPASL